MVKLLWKMSFVKKTFRAGPVVHACNPSYLRGGDERIAG
jgi:hypothetical protein